MFFKALDKKGNEKFWDDFVKENDRQGFKKRIIPLEFLPEKIQKIVISDGRTDKWTNGILVNHQDKLIKFRDGDKFIKIPFQDLYDLRMDSIGVSKTKGWGFGDSITLFNASTTNHLKSITMQIVVKDPNGGVKTVELMLCNTFSSIKRGTPEASAYERCAAAILNEISYIIDKNT